MSASARPAERRRHLCHTRHGLIHVTAQGDGGTPVVCLHMGWASWRQFRNVMPLLATDRLVLGIDRLGLGYSDPPLRQFDSISEYALATLDALDELGVGEFDVIGSHTGATEAVELAGAHPDRVRRVILAACPLWRDDEVEPMIAFMSRTGWRPQADGSHLLARWERSQATGRGEHAVFADPSVPRLNPDAPGRTTPWDPTDILQERLRHSLLAGPNGWWPYIGVFRFPMAERLEALTQPVVVVNANDDLWEVTGRAQGHLPPGGSYLELPHLDVHAFELAPEEMNGIVRSFLDSDPA